MSLIVVEGVDASGKSTLLENSRLEIKKRYFVLMRHSCRPLALSDALQFMRASKHASDIGLDVICDRHPLISEPIYGPIIRSGHLFENHMTYMDPASQVDYIQDEADRVIYCRPPDDVILANIDKNPQLEWVKERILQLLDAYDHRMVELRNARVPVYLYDYTTETRPLSDVFFGDLNI